MINHYQTLGVSRDANPDEIKRAYRKLASQHHPDKGGDKHKFQEIEQAYRILSDPNLKAQHDNPNPGFGGMNTAGFGGVNPFDFETIFSMFGTNLNQHQQRMRQVARMTLWITLTDVAQGGRRTVSVGTPQGTQAIEIEIPLGINDGDTVQYPQVAPGGLDLQITFRIHPNPAWSRNGLNLTQEHTVSVWDLILGTEITVADILGHHLTVTIPAGTQPNAVFRLKGRGLRPRTGTPGDMFVQIQGRVPATIDPELREMIRQIRPQ
jgi:curved DNA-binding protein